MPKPKGSRAGYMQRGITVKGAAVSALVRDLRKEGKSHRQIAEIIGRSKERVSQILKRDGDPCPEEIRLRLRGETASVLIERGAKP